MKWQKLALVAIVLSLLVAPVAAENLYTISGGSEVSNTSYWYAGAPVGVKDTGSWKSIGWFSKLFNPVCFEPQNYTQYIFGTNLNDTSVTICPGTYQEVNFRAASSFADNLEFDCNGAVFVDNFTATFMFITSVVDNATVHDCTVRNYLTGIYTQGDGGEYYNNNITNSSVKGMHLNAFANDTLVWNNFFNNTVDVYDDGPANNWNTSKDCYSGFNIIGGLCKGGNFYREYNGTDTNFDGIGDTDIPFQIPSSFGGYGNGNDYLPLTNDTEMPDASFLAISFLIGLFSIAFILAWLSTTMGIQSRTVTRKQFGEYGFGVDIEDTPKYNHWPLRIYFLLACMLTIVADLHIIAALERDYLTSLGDLTNALIDKLPYAILIIPIFYLLITVLIRVFKHMKEQKDKF